jgi:hypothetical protein
MNMTTLRSIGAVLAGFVFIVITHTGTDVILEGAGVLPKGNLFVPTGLILIVIAYRAVLSFIGCYLTARLAPRNPLKHAVILGLIGLVLSSVGAIVAADLGPSWYAWTLAAISVPIAWLGGKLRERHSRRQNG